jgi:hypothetical protein
MKPDVIDVARLSRVAGRACVAGQAEREHRTATAVQTPALVSAVRCHHAPSVSPVTAVAGTTGLLSALCPPGARYRLRLVGQPRFRLGPLLGARSLTLSVTQ